MADESYQVKAILTAYDEGFTKGMKNAQKSVQGLGKTASGIGKVMKGGFGFGVAAGIGQKAFGAITSGIGEVVSTLSGSQGAWKTFEGNMKSFGKSDATIGKVQKSMQQYAAKTIYSASDMASTYSQFAAVGVKNTTSLVKGFGGLAAAAENPAQAMKTLSQQGTQMAAKPMVQWADFKLMLEQTPAGISKIAEAMGMTTKQLVKDVQDGKVKTDDFFKAVEKAGNTKSAQKMATQFKTVGEAMDGLYESAANALMPVWNKVTQVGIDALAKLGDAVGNFDGQVLADKISAMATKIKPYWDVIKQDAVTVGTAFGKAVSAIGTSLGKLNGAFGSAKNIATFKTVMAGVTTALTKFAGFLEKHSDVVAKVIQQLPKLAAGFAGLKIITAIAGPIGKVGSAFGKIGGVVGGLAGKLLKLPGPLMTTAAGETAAGEAAGASATNTLKLGAAFALIGVGILAAAAGIALITQSAIALAAAGAPAIAIAAGMGIALVALAAGASVVGPALTASSAGLLAFGGAVLMAGAGAALLGVGVLAACAGVTMLAGVLPQIAAAGTSAAAGMTAFMASVVTTGAMSAVAAIGIIALGIAMAGAAIGGAALAIAMKATAASVSSIVSKASAAGAQLRAMVASVSVVKTGLAGVGDAAKGAMSKLISAFTSASGKAKAAGKAVGTGFASTVKSELGKAATSATQSMSKITSALSKGASKAKTSGKQVGTGFSNGLKSGMTKAPSYAAQMNSKVAARIRSGRGAAHSAGAYVGAGVASGLNSQVGAVTAAANRIIAQVNRAMRAKAKIHSPSRLTRPIGIYLAEGLNVGMKKRAKKLKASAKTLVADIASAIRSAAAQANGAFSSMMGSLNISWAGGNYSDAAKNSASAYESSIKSQVAAQEKAYKSNINKAYNAQKKKYKKSGKGISKNEKKVLSKMKTNGSKLLEKYKNSIESNRDQAIDAVTNALTALGDAYQSKYDDLASKRNDLFGKLSETGDLFESDDYGYVQLKDFTAANKQVNKYGANLMALKGKIPSGLMDKIVGMDVQQGLTYTNKLLSMGASELSTYGQQYQKFLDDSTRISKQFYQNDLNKIKLQFDIDWSGALANLQKQLATIGTNVTSGFAKGISQKKSQKKVKKATKKTAKTSKKSTKKHLKSHSPSRVFASIGGDTIQGFVNGIIGMQRQVKVAIGKTIAIPNALTPQLGGLSSSLSSDFDYYTNAHYTVTVPVNLDGKQVAKVTAPYTQEELNKRVTRSNRRHGVL